MAVANSISVSSVAFICFLTLETGNVHAHVKVLSSTCMIQLDTFASWLKCPNDDLAQGHDGLRNSLEKVFCCGPLRNRHCCPLSEKMSEDPRFDPQNYREDLAFEDKYDVYVDKNHDDIPVDRRGGRFWMYLLAFSLILSFTAISMYFFGAVIWMTITAALWCCFGCKESSKMESNETGFKRNKQSKQEEEQLVHVVPRKTYNTIRATSHVDLYTQAPPKYEYQV
ncbi:hypothetical protein TCAL_02001 [Tigriopus californicus]|uniref:Uncharacterized protein n=2 Tax=Tigriopus californicus TaxID=6832 RepID=A0A553PNQ2_TIGCA|nr:hypothetical protein TCAL_02001 [Tigriopus californicus]